MLRIRARYASSILYILAVGTACSATPNGVVAHNDLVSLELSRNASNLELQLTPAPGAQISAQFKPAIETENGTRIIFDSPLVTADSEYFAAPPQVIVEHTSSVTGLLRASVCPKGKQVCMSVELPVAIR